ncbi:Omp28-related outer membrane protein [Flavobacterium sp. xlx-214]|uniref:Omp28-related outer membrane protein n=1 Tax=unclassified Flavobacterium TaxID=196869 RepID=UPI0013CFE82C|nr:MULTISPECIES: Omp28-related outer membrane protein [unclassified Flavobacterium]MBA5793669.1 Omp28-related outer membrane protein [Flavobacterium sp. xlx-221]QMI84594.1 Omp28-related outer membrane protein [Flavobacterium sp. xlx-214]
MFTKKLLPILMLGIVSLNFTACSDSDEPKENEDPSVLIKGSGEKFKHRVAAEDFTGAWCVYCPRVSYAIDESEKVNGDKFVASGLHIGDLSASSQYHDPYNYSPVTALEKALKVTGYPTAYINRDKKWKGPENNNINYPLELYKTTSSVGIKVESTLGASSGTAKVSLKFGEDIKQQLKYVVYVQEDGLVYRQANGTSLYGNDTGKGRWEMNFVHNNVVRAGTEIMGTDIAKDKVTNSEINLDNLSFNYTSVDASKLEITVLVLDADGKVINARTVKGNSASDYEKM